MNSQYNSWFDLFVHYNKRYEFIQNLHALIFLTLRFCNSSCSLLPTTNKTIYKRKRKRKLSWSIKSLFRIRQIEKTIQNFILPFCEHTFWCCVTRGGIFHFTNIYNKDRMGCIIFKLFCLCLELPESITSNNRSFGCPIICTDIYSQCYFVHWHPQQCLIELNSLANWDAIFFDNCQ